MRCGFLTEEKLARWSKKTEAIGIASKRVFLLLQKKDDSAYSAVASCRGDKRAVLLFILGGGWRDDPLSIFRLMCISYNCNFFKRKIGKYVRSSLQ